MPKDIRQDIATEMINRVLQPSGFFLALNETPHFIDFYFVSKLNHHIDLIWVSQFIAICRRVKWSKHVTNSPFLALLAMAGSHAACKINSACSNAFRSRKFRRN
jgi:hypothetical protein